MHCPGCEGMKDLWWWCPLWCTVKVLVIFQHLLQLEKYWKSPPTQCKPKTKKKVVRIMGSINYLFSCMVLSE